MRNATRWCVLWIVLMLCAIWAHAGDFVAYSLREAQERCGRGEGNDRALTELGSITELAGMVHDSVGSDWIVVGRANAAKPGISLDDLAVAFRAVLAHQKAPLVSIEKTEESVKQGRQIVRYEGGIENTQLAKDMIDADFLLKQMALNRVPAEVWGVCPYSLQLAEHARRGQAERRLFSRFWFKNVSPSLGVREGVFAIMDLHVGIATEVLQANVQGKEVADLSTFRDEVGDAFAESVELNLGDLGEAYPVLKRAHPILALVSLAEGVRRLGGEAEMAYWLRQFRPRTVETPESFDILDVTEIVAGAGMRMTISGGVEMNPMVVGLRKGRLASFKNAVLSSRPSGDTLVWHPPLEGWRVPGAEDIEGDLSLGSDSGEGPGFGLDAVLCPANASAAALPHWNSTPLRAETADFTIHDALPAQNISDQVGGVMLRGAAEVKGGAGRVDLGSGGFSLVVDGANARLAPEEFRRFVTALWAIYYTKQDPGISIDPIAPDVDKHLVRYIGNVVNSDLGRVMREADYIMKKWAVGTERPNVPGFKDVDDLAARHGLNFVGASRRFWFVPEDMTFKRAGEMLLFDTGRMTVKTEYVVQNKGVKAEPGDEAFAAFFTKQYPKIAEKHPVYQELFGYAKLVSLAKYLKESGAPLFWFLMANKDLVLTEDSPGTVDALAKGSKHFEGITIQGGVDLGFEGEYVYDAAAANAISAAVSKIPANASSSSLAGDQRTARATPNQPFTFDLRDRSYSVLPQGSLTSGKDRRGIRYQTDLALRQGGQPGLEVVRYFRPGEQEGGEFGQGWHLLIPYRVRPIEGKTTPFRNAVVPAKMAVVNLLSGEEEILTFSTDRYSIAGYVPDKVEASQVIGLFILSNMTFRLADKLGNEFWFDQAGLLTDLVFSEEHHVHIEYQREVTTAFAEPPYTVKGGAETFQWRNVVIPRKMVIADAVHGYRESLVFSDQGPVVGYVPERQEKSRFKFLALLSDASFQLVDRKGNEIAFKASGKFAGAIPSPERPLVAAMTSGDQTVRFSYSITGSGEIAIARAVLTSEKRPAEELYAVNYQYDNEGRLAKAQGPTTQLAKVSGGAGESRPRTQ